MHDFTFYKSFDEIDEDDLYYIQTINFKKGIKRLGEIARNEEKYKYIGSEYRQAFIKHSYLLLLLKPEHLLAKHVYNHLSEKKNVINSEIRKDIASVFNDLYNVLEDTNIPLNPDFQVLVENYNNQIKRLTEAINKAGGTLFMLHTHQTLFEVCAKDSINNQEEFFKILFQEIPEFKNSRRYIKYYYRN